jgi:CBS-domain-containing membrane protein
MWIAFIGWFLASAAGGTVQHISLEQQFEGVTVADVMRRNPLTIDAAESVEEAVHSYLLAYNLRALPVVRYGRLVGLITLADLARSRACAGRTRLSASSSKGYRCLPQLGPTSASLTPWTR